MPMIKSNTQRGDCDMFECRCGSHIIKIIKDEPYTNAKGIMFPPMHTLEFWEYRGDTSWTLWQRIKLAFRILIGKEAKNCTYDVLIEDTDIDDFIVAFQKLKLPSEKPKITLAELRERLNTD